MPYKKNVIEIEYKDSIELILDYAPNLKKYVLEVQLTSYNCAPNDFIVLSREQVDVLIQKLLDVRRNWPSEKEK